MRYEHRAAYRHPDGNVEGFVGHGDTKPRAKADALDQMRRKADIVAECDGCSCAFDDSRIIYVLASLTKGEIASVQADWRSTVRY